MYKSGSRVAFIQQYQDIVNHAADAGPSLPIPQEGWLRTARKALGISGAQLARRLGVTRARIANAEQAELTGGITLKSMQATAEAMGCRLVYAIVPPNTTEGLIWSQAQKKAAQVVARASQHMALENQTLSATKIENQTDKLARRLMHDMPPDFWDDK